MAPAPLATLRACLFAYRMLRRNFYIFLFLQPLIRLLDNKRQA